MEDVIHSTLVMDGAGHVAHAIHNGQISEHGAGLLLIAHMGDDGDAYGCGAEAAHQHAAHEAGGTGDENGFVPKILPVGENFGHALKIRAEDGIDVLIHGL